jgi:predicted transcriptional regulator
MFKKKLWMFVGGTLIAMMLIGSVGAVVVYAQSPTPTATSVPSTGRTRPGAGAHGTYLAGAELDAAAQALGMTSADLSAELKSGKTPSQIATEKGVNLQTVMAAIQTARKADFTTQINQAVTAGKLTQDKANWLLEGLDKGYINGPGFGFGFGFSGTKGTQPPAAGTQAQATPHPRRTPQAPSGSSTLQPKTGAAGRTNLSGTVLDAAAKALGMTSADLSAELKSGKTLTAIVTEKGANLQTVQAAIQTARNAQFTTQINQAVTAGKMTQDKANWLLEGLSKGYTNGAGFFGFGFGFGGTKGTHTHAGGMHFKGTPQPTPTQP